MTAKPPRRQLRLTKEPLRELLKRRVADNPKDHDSEFIKEMIDRYGYIWPVLVDDKTGKLGAGHGRLEDLQRRRDAGEDRPAGIDAGRGGEWLVPVLRGVSFASLRDLRGFIVGDNRAVERGGWQDGLGKYLKAFGDDLAGVGYSAEQARALLGGRDDAAVPKLKSSWAIIVDCRDERQQTRLLEKFGREGLKVRALVS